MNDVDPRQWVSVLLHPAEAFTREGIEQRAQGINEPAERVETFTWLLEIAAQASEVASDLLDGTDQPLILRGGTSVQLRVGEGRQRASGDVDVLLRGTLEDAEQLIARLNERLAPCAPFLQFAEMQRTERPIEEFRAWRSFVPRQFASARPGQEGDPGRNVLFEVHAIENDESPPTAPLASSAFGLALHQELTALTTGSLIGDKLDCLAPSSIGIEEGRYDKHARHIYDLTMLSQTHVIDAETLADAAKAVSYFTRRDAVVRKYDAVSPADTMRDAERFLATWGWPKFAGSPIRDQIARARSFEQNVPQSQRVGAIGWAQRALDASLLARAVREAIEDSPALAIECHSRRRALIESIVDDEDHLNRVAGRILDRLQDEHLAPDGQAVPRRKSQLASLLPRNASPAQRRRLATLAAVVLGEDESKIH